MAGPSRPAASTQSAASATSASSPGATTLPLAVSLAPPATKPLTRARIERMISRVVAGLGLVFAVQIIPALTESLPLMNDPWGMVNAAIVLGGVGWVVVAAIVQRTVNLANTIAASVYLVSLIIWPLIVSDHSAAPAKPWLWYLCTVATAYAAVAFSPLIAGVYTVVTPTVYGLLRQSPSGGGASVTDAVLDIVYAIILGGAVLLIITMMRQAASGVDAAQSAALDRYTAVAREHAHEAERAEVDAIVHDSVLTTLLAAAGAHSSESMAVSARMAAEAIGHLDAATDPVPDDGAVLGLDRLSERVSSSARSFSAPFRFSASKLQAVVVPVVVADALHAAAVQAMVNSMQHAGSPDAVRSVTIVGSASGGVDIAVTDDGVGFDPAIVAPERLGLRVSIVERVARVGGRVEVRSAPGSGTTIAIHWNVEEAAEAAGDAARTEQHENPQGGAIT
jgi:signal transduction histidine kinase